MNKWKTVKYKNILVYYLPELDGGGRLFGQDFIPVVKKLFGKVDTICEFAAGPGFIGFSLLAHGLCNKLCLIDINPSAIDACKKTIKENQLGKKVNVYISDALNDVPEKEKWDLVVSNPPHFDGSFSKRKGDLLVIDRGWKIHKAFYLKIKKYLNQNGSVLFVENSHGSSAETFKGIVTKGGLSFVKSFRHEPSLQKVLSQNIIYILKKIDIDTVRRIFAGKMIVNPSNVLNIGEYPLYFMWSKK